jgi:AraC family transcriptional regulator of arabinose operon
MPLTAALAICCCSSQKPPTIMVVHRKATAGFTAGSIFGRAPTGATETLLAEFDRLFASIEQTHTSGRRFAEELAMNLLERLLLRAVEEDPRSHQQVRDPRVIEACQYLTSQLASEVKIEEVARYVCLSPSRLAHLFREQMGVNLLRWREDQRVIRARLLLQTTQEPIAAIGRQVGYDDQLYFSRVFRKRVGISPSDFRRRNQDAHDELVQQETFMAKGA